MSIAGGRMKQESENQKSLDSWVEKSFQNLKKSITTERTQRTREKTRIFWLKDRSMAVFPASG
jgi:hypothetical protein